MPMVLTRRPGETIRIDNNIKVRIVRVDGNRVRVEVDAPREVPVDREEVWLKKHGEAA